MTKRLVDIDDDLLVNARRIAGTSTIRETVETGLRRIVATDLVEQHVGRLRRHPLDVDAVDEARTPRGSLTR